VITITAPVIMIVGIVPNTSDQMLRIRSSEVGTIITGTMIMITGKCDHDGPAPSGISAE